MSNPSTTRQYLTRYEEAAIVGIRATELANQAMPLVDPGGETHDWRLAFKELRAGALTGYATRRHQPDGSFVEADLGALLQRDSAKKFETPRGAKATPDELASPEYGNAAPATTTHTSPPTR